MAVVSLVDHSGLILWHEKYLDYNFGKNHPLSPTRLELFMDHINDNLGELKVEVLSMDSTMPIEYLKAVVIPKYFQKLLEMSDTGIGFVDEGSTPALKGMMDIIQLYCQGTYLGIKSVLEGHHNYAFNPLGGRHHAGPSVSGGSSIINDMAVSIKKLREEGKDHKFAIIDLDYHPHDGTLMHFGGDSTVFTGSIHDAGWGTDPNETGWGSGLGTSINIGVKDLITDEEYISLLIEQLLPKVRNFNPDIILYVNGIDGHQEDPITSRYPVKSISLADDTYVKCAEILVDFAQDVCEGKIVALGAGGYSPQATARCWYNTVRVFSNFFNR